VGGLLGRLAEQAACEAALSAGGGATAALLTGAPGIGKTSLWRALAGSQPAGMVVLRTTGVASRQAAFANLADLLDPVADSALPALPEAQAQVLGAVLGRALAPIANAETVLERAVIGVLRALADAGVMVAVDDEQWLDDDSRRLLGTAAVRLAGTPVRWLVAARSGLADHSLVRVLGHELAGRVTQVELAGLDDATLTDLVLNREPGRWSPSTVRRVVALAAGSPYAALEIARETAARGEAGQGGVRVPSTLIESLRGHLERLQPETLTVVQAAALMGSPTRTALRAVTGGFVDGQVDEALEAGVLEATSPDPVLRFSHPLLREAAEGLLTGPGRRRLHRLIGAAIADIDEAAWHLTRGADEPDEALAETAEQAAERVSARGAQARAAGLSMAAAQLTPDQDGLTAWRRRVVWLERLTAAGEHDQVRQLSEEWTPRVPVAVRGRLTAVRAHVAIDMETASALLAEAITDLATADPLRAARLGSELAGQLGVQLGLLAEARMHAAAAAAQARAAGDVPVLREAQAMDGLLAALSGECDAGERLRAAVRLPGLDDMPYPYYSPETYLAYWHLWRGELGRARDLLDLVLETSEHVGSVDSAVGCRLHLVEVEWRAGNWDLARLHAEKYNRWHREGGYGQRGVSAYLESLVAASRGDIDGARHGAASGVDEAEAEHDWTFAAQCRWVLGLAELSVDDPAAALRWLEPVADMLQSGGIGEPGCYPFTPDLIEAWAATGQLDRAADRLAWLQEAAQRLDHPWARITAGRAEAVLRLAQGDPAAAVVAVSAVIAEAHERGLVFELGRCLLVLGTAQRKARQRSQAAASLDDAIALFSGLGASRWLTLARAQRDRLSPGGDGTLTPTERRIAELVGAGHSNPEIAAAMYISIKTVEANLTRIYRKLGLRGRVDLARHSID
jgi:DNA-binding CsgD family transcriptional regulator